jgi:hypothetical protein
MKRLDALNGRLDTGDHSALDHPGFGTIEKLGIAAHFALGGRVTVPRITQI